MPSTLTRDIPRRRGSWQVQYFPEAASSTFKVGDIVVVNSSGQVAIGAAAGNDMTNSVKFLGIAGEAASGTTNTNIKVYVPAASDAHFLLPVEHATAASAVTAETQVDETFVLTHTTAGVWGVAIDTTTNACVKIMDISDDYAVADQHGTVWCAPIAANRFNL